MGPRPPSGTCPWPWGRRPAPPRTCRPPGPRTTPGSRRRLRWTARRSSRPRSCAGAATGTWPRHRWSGRSSTSTRATAARSAARCRRTLPDLLVVGRLNRTDQLRHDVAAYRGIPPTDDEAKLAEFAETTPLDDDADWEALYADSET